MSFYDVLFLFVGWAIGVAGTIALFVNDPDLVRLKPDELIVKKPQEGLTLIAVTQSVARRIIMAKEKIPGQVEARDLYETEK